MAGGSWTYPAGASAGRAAPGRIAHYAIGPGVSEPQLEDLKLAVTEAATNALIHACTSRGTVGTFTVEIDVCPRDRIVLRACDDGHGMRPRDDSPGLGMGLGIIDLLADETM